MGGWPVTRPMAQNYDPVTGIIIMGACMEGCGPSCVPRCVLDPDRCTDMICSEPGLEMKFNEEHARLMDEHRERRHAELHPPAADLKPGEHIEILYREEVR